jgi:hypothetical protein
MDGHARRGLKVPSLLAISVLALGCPAEEENETGAGSDTTSGSESGGTTASETTSASGSGSASTTTAATSEGSSGEGSTGIGTDSTADESGSDTGPPADCSMIDEPGTCTADPECEYYREYGGCVYDCELVTDQATCIMYGHCEWFENTCHFAALK